MYDEAFFKSLMWCRIWFNRVQENVAAKVLTQKTELDLEFNPIYPLIFD